MKLLAEEYNHSELAVWVTLLAKNVGGGYTLGI